MILLTIVAAQLGGVLQVSFMFIQRRKLRVVHILTEAEGVIFFAIMCFSRYIHCSLISFCIAIVGGKHN